MKHVTSFYSTVLLFLNSWLEQPSSTCISEGHLSETSSTRESFQELDSGQELPGDASGEENSPGAPQIHVAPIQAPDIDRAPSTWQEVPGVWDTPDEAAQDTTGTPGEWGSPEEPPQ